MVLPGVGTCGVTAPGGDCKDLAHGAYDASKSGIKTLSDCVAKVKGCANGNYVSFSTTNNDCSWYSHCDMSRLMKVGASYTSEVVTGKDVPGPPGKPTCPIYRYISHSADGGETWPIGWWARDLPDPIVFSDMVSTADGSTLLLTHPASDVARRNVSLFSSSDGGASWRLQVLMDGGPSQYSSLAMLPNGSVAIQWDSGCQTHDSDPNCTRACHSVSMRCNGCHACPDKPGQSGCYQDCGQCPESCVDCHIIPNVSTWNREPGCDKAAPTHDEFAVVTL